MRRPRGKGDSLAHRIAQLRQQLGLTPLRTGAPDRGRAVALRPKTLQLTLLRRMPGASVYEGGYRRLGIGRDRA